jgi:hypothetical protein
VNGFLKVAVAVVGLAVGATAVLLLREATLSTHQPVPAGSRATVVVDVDTRNRERDQHPGEMVSALLTVCRLEVDSDLIGEVVALGEGRYRAVLTPALDETNRRQFLGCVEDWTIDGLRADVVALDQTDTP